MKPVICLETGGRLPSICAAARAVGRSVSSMHRAIGDGSTCGGRHFYLADEQKPPACFFRHKKPSGRKPVRCVETGRTFPSVCAAAREYAIRSAWVSTSAIRKSSVRGLSFRYVNDER